MHINLAVIAALSYTTSAMTLTQFDSEGDATLSQLDTEVAIANSAEAEITKEAWDQGTALAQVNDILAKMPNAEVLTWLKNLEADKWNRLAENPPIDMTADNLTIISSFTRHEHGPGLGYDLYNLINDTMGEVE
jgi:hypothetical protein